MYFSTLTVGIEHIEGLLAQAGSSGSLIGLLPLVFIFVVFYLILIRPQQKRQKEWEAKLQTLQNGDRVVTSGGMMGTIIAVKDQSFYLRIPPDNLRVEVTKSAVVSVFADDVKS